MSRLIERINFRERFGEVILALVLGIYALKMMPVASSLYSQSGLFPAEYSTSPIGGLPIWGPLNSELFLYALHMALFLFSCCWIMNFLSPWAQVLHFFSTWYLVNRNPSLFAPDTGFTQGVLLILCFQNFVTRKQRLVLGWLMIGVAYSYAGIGKLSSPVWTGGYAVRYFLNMSDSTRLWVPEFGEFFHYPMAAMTFGVLAFEVFALLLLLNRWGRLSVLIFFGFFHLINVAIFDFVQLSLCCVAAHLVVAQWAYLDSEDFKFEKLLR